jgi:hypothetical protein
MNNYRGHEGKFRPAPAQLLIGILFVIMGAIFLFGQFLGTWFIAKFWPFFLIAGGLIFFAVFFLRHIRPPGYEGLLFPGTYLTILGLLFFLMNIVGWQAMRYFWPTFVFGVAISLGVMYKYSPREDVSNNKDLIGAIRVLTVISIILYLIAIGGLRLWPLALILIGLIIILKGFGRKRDTTISEG